DFEKEILVGLALMPEGARVLLAFAARADRNQDGAGRVVLLQVFAQARRTKLLAVQPKRRRLRLQSYATVINPGPPMLRIPGARPGHELLHASAGLVSARIAQQAEVFGLLHMMLGLGI